MSFSANKLRISMGLPSSQFPIFPRSHERTAGNWLACQRVACELGSLAGSPRSRFLGSFTEHFDGLPTIRPSGLQAHRRLSIATWAYKHHFGGALCTASTYAVDQKAIPVNRIKRKRPHRHGDPLALYLYIYTM